MKLKDLAAKKRNAKNDARNILPQLDAYLLAKRAAVREGIKRATLEDLPKLDKKINNMRTKVEDARSELKQMEAELERLEASKPVQLHASSIGDCPKIIVAKVICPSALQSGITADEVSTFENGDGVHERIQWWFTDMGLAKHIEYSFSYAPWHVTGKFDILLNYRVNGNFALVEIKSTSDEVDKMIRPHEQHFMQLQTYIFLAKEVLGLDTYGIILYEQKVKRQKHRAFIIERDEKIISQIGDKCHELWAYVEKKRLPVVTRTNSKDCGFCKNKKWCDKTNESKGRLV